MEKWLSDYLPIATLEHDCIVSQNGDITAVFRAVYPECLTRSNEEYEALNVARIKAIQSLPDNSLFVLQDWYRSKTCSIEKQEKSFLQSASNQFFAGRTYLEHDCLISLTKMPPKRQVSNSGINNLLRTSITPEQTVSQKALNEWKVKSPNLNG